MKVNDFKIPVVTLSYQPEMLENFIKCYLHHNAITQDMVIVVNDHMHKVSAYLKHFKGTEHYKYIKKYIVKMSDIEDYAISKYDVKNYKLYCKSAPNQIKLLIPIYVKEVLNYDNMLWLDDDILINCNIEKLMNDIMPKHMSEYKKYETDKMNALFKDFWILLSQCYSNAMEARNMMQFISCAFWFKINDDFATYVQKYYQDPEILRYLTIYTYNFTYKSGMGDALNAFEEYTFNYYNNMKSEEGNPNFWIPPVFHTWTERDKYRNINMIKQCPFVHAHFQPKTQWAKLYWPEQQGSKPQP